MTTQQWIGAGLVVGQWLALLAILRLPSFGSLTERSHRSNRDIAADHQVDLELLKIQVGTLKQLVDARAEIAELKRREIA